MADVVSAGGLLLLQQLQNKSNDLILQATGMSSEVFSSLSEDERIRSGLLATPSQTEELAKIAVKGQKLQKLANIGIYDILLTYLITSFEAYIEDILVTITKSSSTFQNQIEQELQNRGKLSRTKPKQLTPRELVKRLIYGEFYSDFAQAVFNNMLSIDFTDICKKAQTTVSELDKAKAVRNLYIHNRGVVDQFYQNRVKEPTPLIGEVFPLTFGYVKDIKDKMLMTALYVDKEIVQSFPNVKGVQP